MFRPEVAGGGSCPATNCADPVTVAVVGCGATGRRTARQLAAESEPPQLLLVDENLDTAKDAAGAIGSDVGWATSVDGSDVDSVVLAVRAGDHHPLAREAIKAGRNVVSVSDSIADVRPLLRLDDLARSKGVTVVAGAGMMPGLTDVLAAHGAGWFDAVDEIHVAKFGTGGPDCARQHHRALKGVCFDRRDGDWVRRAGGSGRELAWFPAPVQAADCYRAALADPLLLTRSHPGVNRITSRMAATRRDRLTMHLPMLRRPHPEGLLGAVRVELRGRLDGKQADVVLGCSERPAVAAGAVAAATVIWLRGRSNDARGVFGLGELVEPTSFLHSLCDRGLRPELFVGVEAQY